MMTWYESKERCLIEVLLKETLVCEIHEQFLLDFVTSKRLQLIEVRGRKGIDLFNHLYYV